jgi:hypothetical protein
LNNLFHHRERQYNHTGENYFNVSKERSFGLIMTTAKEITRECLPIKCVEAVMLAILLTNAIVSASPTPTALLRLPLRFKTKVDGHVFRYTAQHSFRHEQGVLVKHLFRS